MEKDEIKLSRRSFLKATAVTAGGLYLFGNTADTADAVSLEDQNLSNHKDSTDYWFKDSIGRKVRIPEKINKVIPSGHYAQTLLCTLCSNKLVSVADKPQTEEKTQYREINMQEVYKLPETGIMYKVEGEREINTGTVSKIESDIIIDAGHIKEDLELSLEYLQNNTGTPVIFIDASFGKLPQAYRTLGKILNCESRAEELAVYIENLYADIRKRRVALDGSIKILYAGNKNGLYKNIGYSVQNEVITFLGGTPVSIPEGEKEYKMDEAALERKTIDYIVFNDISCVKDIMHRKGKAYEIWSSVGAIESSKYALSPGLFHNLIGFSMFAQSIGLLWLGHIVWPDIYNYNIADKIKEFYKLFYSYEVKEDELAILLFGSSNTMKYSAGTPKTE